MPALSVTLHDTGGLPSRRFETHFGQPHTFDDTPIPSKPD